jgi:hypothetical protein
VNLVSVVFAPQQNRMWLACGSMPAARGPYREYELFPADEPGGTDGGG